MITFSKIFLNRSTFLSVFPQAPAEVGNPFRSNPPHADALRQSAREVFPFQFSRHPHGRAKEQAAFFTA